MVLQEVIGVVGGDGGALVLMDPHTSLFTTGAVSQLPAPSCHPFFRFEVGSDSPRTFRRLAATGGGAVALSRSRVQDGYADSVLGAHGYADELRVVCRDGGTSWGALSLWRRPTSGRFTVDDEQALDAVASMIGGVLREAVVRSLGASPHRGSRHVVVIENGVVVEASEDIAADLFEPEDPQVEQFRHLDHLKELALRDARFSTVVGGSTAGGSPRTGRRSGPGGSPSCSRLRPRLTSSERSLREQA